MRAKTQYTDYSGSSAADISDLIATYYGDNIESIAKYFHLDLERFKPIGISFSGVENFKLSLICVDKGQSTIEKEYIVKIICESGKGILKNVFKSLEVVLYDEYDDKYPALDCDAVEDYSVFHRTNGKSNKD